MDATELRALQAPLKERYRADPDTAVVTLTAAGELDGQAVTCRVDTGRTLVEAGLHLSAGGDGLAACSGDMLLELTERYCVIYQTLRTPPPVAIG